MVQPINYILDVQTPFEAAVSGFKLGAAGQEAQAQRQAREAAALEAERVRKNSEAVQALINNPKATFQQYQAVAATLPADQRKMLQENFAALTSEEKQMRLRDGGQVMSALVAGQPQTAIDLLTARAQAERNAGREEKAKGTEDTIKFMKLNPTNAHVIFGTTMADIDEFKPILEAATTAMKPSEADKPTAFQQDFKFINQMFGPKAAAEYAQFGRSGIVSIPLGNGSTYVGPPSMAPGASTWQQQAQTAQGMAPAQEAPTGQAAKPETQKGVDFILNEAMKKRRIDQSTVNVLKQSFGAEGQTQLNKWLLDNNVRVVVRRGYDKSTGQSVVEFSDGKVEYGTD
jgi:hypothetical protein